MKWFNVYRDGLPNKNQRVLTYSECYKNTPEMAFRILDGQFVKMCRDVTHYAYLVQPVNPPDKPVI